MMSFMYDIYHMSGGNLKSYNIYNLDKVRRKTEESRATKKKTLKVITEGTIYLHRLSII